MSEQEEVPEKQCILVVEDSAPNRRIITSLVEKLDFATVSCNDGKEAWEKYQAGIPNLAAIISDIMMPNMDGIELLELIRKSDSTNKDIPFFFCTAVMDKDYILKSKELGVNAYIVKPITQAKIEAKLKQLFPNKKWPMIA